MKKFSFDYDKIPNKYKVGKRCDDFITLYRGDIVDLFNFKSKALQSSDYFALTRAKAICESMNEEAIHTLIDNHTSSSYNSPLISLTPSPQMAQLFAAKNNRTIYQMRIRADRLIYDEEGEYPEFFAFGVIFSSEILAVKIKNDDEHSELLFTDQNGTNWIKSRLPKEPMGDRIKDSNNWKSLVNEP